MEHAASCRAPEVIWSEFSVPLRAFIARRVPREVDPDDVLQDVFVRVQESLPKLKEQQRLDAWLFQIARNVMIDAGRRGRRKQAATAQATASEPDEAAMPEDDTATEEFVRCLAPLIASLDEPYREAIQLTDLKQLAQKDAAQQVGISVSGMKSRVQRGRQQLKLLFQKCCEIEFDRRGGIADYTRRDSEVAASCCDASGCCSGD
jgi:RNA polymerase sigma-70 factor (ECF subfamily)